MNDSTRPSGDERPLPTSTILAWATGAFLMVFTMPFEGPYASVTSGPGLAAAADVLFALIVYTTGYSMFNVAYLAMPAEMTTGYHERSRIHAWRVMFSALGGFVVSAMLGVLLEYYGKSRQGHAILGVAGATGIRPSARSRPRRGSTAAGRRRSFRYPPLPSGRFEFRFVRQQAH